MLLGKIKEKISRIGIKQKILMLISLFGLMIIATYTIISYLDARSSIYKSIDDRILAGSFAVHFAVGDEFHDSNWDSQTIPEEKHLENIKQLNKVCKRLGLVYVYTMVMKNDSVFFTSSSATDEELEKKSYSPYLDSYPEASDVLKITFSDKKEKFEEYADRWGNFRSGFIPFTTSQGHTYLVGADISIGEVNAQLVKALMKNIIIGLIIYAGFFLVSFVVAGRIARPIHKLAEDAKQIAAGKYDIEIKVPTQDETRLLGDALSSLASNVKQAFETLEAEKAGVERKVVEAIKEIEGQKVYLEKSVETMLGAMGRFSDGDLTVALKIENDDDIGRMYSGFNKTVDDFRAVVRQVSTSVFETASASRQISSSTEEMAAGGQEQITEATKISGAVEEMTKTIFDNTKNAAQAAARAREVGDKAREGGNVVLETVDGMNKIAEVVIRSAVTIRDLGQSSSQIGEIIEVINDIADQTNLLALNAAIEAARAGEQGRGFAVVADEVRKLAERTTHATQEIGSMIKLIQKNTGGAVEAIEQGTREVEKGKALAGKAGNALKEIIEGTSEVTDLIGQLASASEEQSATSDEISRNIESITTVTRQSAAGIEQIARAADDLRNLTETLQALISHFHVGEETAVHRQSMLASS